MRLTLKTHPYNTRRYGKPYIAIIEFQTPKGEPKWGSWIGNAGDDGMLVIDAEPGDVIMLGQRDNRKMKNSAPDYYILQDDGTLKLISKSEAYMHYNNRISQS